MYYHVLVEVDTGTNAKPNSQIAVEFDKPDLLDIKEDIVAPYLSEEKFVVDGYQIQPDQVKRLLIKRSEQKIEALRNIAQSKISRNVIWVVSSTEVLQDKEYTEDVTKDVFKEVRNGKSKSPQQNQEAPTLDRSKVFIVHGHDELAKTEAARLIEKLGFEAIVLHEQPSEGKTIIEKIEAYAGVGFGIVLYTPDDIGSVVSEEPDLQKRARQNVVFEHGYLIGRLGRKNVTALVKGSLEKPNDISGVVYVPMDSGAAWKFEVAKEMRASGYAVDMNKL